MRDHTLPVFGVGPVAQPTAIECYRRGDGRLVVQIREDARVTRQLVNGINDLLSDSSVRAAIQRALRRYVQRTFGVRGLGAERLPDRRRLRREVGLADVTLRGLDAGVPEDRLDDPR